MWLIISLIFLDVVTGIYGARILAVFPVPSISHQVVFRPLTQELARRGHDVTVITPDPIFPKGQSPQNFTEIDVHHVSYKIWRENFLRSDVTSGSKEDHMIQMTMAQELILKVFEVQMNCEEVKKIINDKGRKFDLLLIEAVAKPALVFSYIYKAPLIQISSLAPIYNNMEVMGSPIHPFLYPSLIRQRINNLTLWEKFTELYIQYKFESMLDSMEDKITTSLRKIFGEHIPHITELYNNIDMLLLNVYRIWDYNRPSPPSVVYLGAMHRNPEKPLPKDLQSYLDSSKHGVIYMSFGTNVSPSALPPEKIQMFVKVFSTLPYDVLWKWDKDELPGKSANIKISKWLPQSDLLRHPKIKFFITQGGLQSTDESISAGVPMLCVPMLGDQWFNAEQYVRLNIGMRLDMELVTEGTVKDAVNKMLTDNTYRTSIAKVRALLADEPETPLYRAVWWTEYVLRHGGARHLRGPAANMSWLDYLEFKLISYLLLSGIFIMFFILTILYYIISFTNNAVKLKSN